MESASLVVAAGLVLLSTVLALLLVRGRAESRRHLAAAQAETDELRARLDQLAARLEETSTAMTRAESTRETAYVITDAGTSEAAANVPDRVVLSATVGEPLVKAVAFGHGVRRALSAESRNRIWFEMRREVRASRRRRRRENRAFVREARAAQRAAGERPGAAA
jgi:hypothetical protein